MDLAFPGGLEEEMNTYALGSVANEGAWLQGASMSRRGIAKVCPLSSRSRAKRCRPVRVNSLASCKDLQRTLRSGNVSLPVGNVFVLGCLALAGKTFARPGRCQRFFPSKVFSRHRSMSRQASTPRMESADSNAGTSPSMHQSWYGSQQRHPLVVPYGAQKVAKSKLRFLRNTRVIVLA
jgi:hypothetical protein